MKADLDELYKKIDIRNVDLKVDSSVTDVCKIANNTSNITRGSLYFSIIISIFSLIIILNTRPSGWLNSRVKDADSLANYARYNFALEKIKTDLIYLAKDSIKNNLAYFKELDSVLSLSDTMIKASNGYLKSKLKLLLSQQSNNSNLVLLSNRIDTLKETTNKIRITNADALHQKIINDIQFPQLPILATTFDVNDFGIIIGFIFIFLLLVQYYGSNRETLNTKIAFRAISERYRDEQLPEKVIKEFSNGLMEEDYTLIKRIRLLNKDLIDDFENSYVNKGKGNNNDDNNNAHVADSLILKKLNKKRRKYLYNFLTMNEVFNMPKIKNTNDSFLMNVIKAVVYLLDMFPFFIFVLLIRNDYATVNSGLSLDSILTVDIIFFDAIFLMIILALCLLIWSTQYRINKMYDDFFDNDYSVLRTCES